MEKGVWRWSRVQGNSTGSSHWALKIDRPRIFMGYSNGGYQVSGPLTGEDIAAFDRRPAAGSLAKRQPAVSETESRSTGRLLLSLLPSKYLIGFRSAPARRAVVTNHVTERGCTDPQPGAWLAQDNPGGLCGERRRVVVGRRSRCGELDPEPWYGGSLLAVGGHSRPCASTPVVRARLEPPMTFADARRPLATSLVHALDLVSGPD